MSIHNDLKSLRTGVNRRGKEKCGDELTRHFAADVAGGFSGNGTAFTDPERKVSFPVQTLNLSP